MVSVLSRSTMVDPETRTEAVRIPSKKYAISPKKTRFVLSELDTLMMKGGAEELQIRYVRALGRTSFLSSVTL